MDDIHEKLGRHAAQLQGIQRDTDALWHAVREIKDGVQSINIQMAETRGGWKTLSALLIAAGTVGSILTQFWQWLGK